MYIRSCRSLPRRSGRRETNGGPRKFRILAAGKPELRNGALRRLHVGAPDKRRREAKSAEAPTYDEQGRVVEIDES